MVAIKNKQNYSLQKCYRKIYVYSRDSILTVYCYLSKVPNLKIHTLLFYSPLNSRNLKPIRGGSVYDLNTMRKPKAYNFVSIKHTIFTGKGILTAEECSYLNQICNETNQISVQ